MGRRVKFFKVYETKALPREVGNTLGSLIESWNRSETYSTGDLVIFCNKIYRALDSSVGVLPQSNQFSTEISTNSSVNSNDTATKWEEV